MAYRFEELGWLLFQELAVAVLSAGDPTLAACEWVGDADRKGRIARPSRPVHLPGHDRPVRTAAVEVRWFREVDTWRMLQSTHVPPHAVAVNADAAAWPPGRFTVVGPAALSTALDADPALRRRLPYALGVRDLDDLLDADVVARSTLDLAAARELARVIVSTRSYHRALDVLERHGFAVVTGPPEMGKTAIARAIALARLTEGWEAHECTRPEQLWDRFDRDRPQVFVADDAFGSTEYHPDAAERWALDLDRVLRAMDERHWLLWTSRPAPLRAGLERIRREHGVERFPQPAEVHVDAADLHVADKAAMLLRHAQAAGLSATEARTLREHAVGIVEHPHVTPERIRRLVSERAFGDGMGAVARAVAEAIRVPTAAMAASFEALEPAHRSLLVALLDAPPGAVPERELAMSARRHLGGGLSRSPAELVDRLTDHFLRLGPGPTVAWVHPSWRDLVIERLAADAEARRAFLARTGIDGLVLALSVGGGAAGERRLPLLVADADWDAIADALHAVVRDGADADVLRLLLGLAEALRAELDPGVRREALALAEQGVAEVERRLDAEPPPAPVGLLVGWLELADEAGEMRLTRALSAAWIELAPPREALPGEVHPQRVEDWQRLFETVERIGPDELATLDGVDSARFRPREDLLPFEPDPDWVLEATWRPRPDLGHDLVHRILADLEPPAT